MITPIDQIELNDYGNVDYVPEGWAITKATVPQLKKLNVPTVKYCSGFEDTGYGWKPLLKNIVPSNYISKIEAYLEKKLKEKEEKPKKQEELKKKRVEMFRKKYSNRFNALPDACEGMVSLNRYAKYACEEKKDNIYELKEKFLQFLIDNGKLKSVKIHEVEREEKICKRCEGTGETWDGECPSCDGTGIFEGAYTKKFYLYEFEVGGKIYSWHSPWKLQLPKDFPVADDPNSDWVEGVLREINLPKNQLKKYFQLIEWVVGKDTLT